MVSKKIVKNLQLSLALLMSMAIASSCNAVTPTKVNTTYQGNLDNFPNPERGFYKSIEPIVKSTNPLVEEQGPALQLSELQQLRSEGTSMVRRYYLLAEFRNKPISQSFLDYISNDLKTARQAGIKVIIRFTYNWLGGGPDASKDTILAHLDQLKPVLQANSDAIAYMEAGFIGYWGEWHHSTNNLVDTTTGKITEDAKTIFLKILSVLPKERMIALRYLRHKQQLFGDKPLTLAEAFNSSNRARTGHHNDSFRSNKNDWGTYAYNNPEVMEQEKAWLNQDTQYVVQGGEPSLPATDPPNWDDCPGALTDFARMHWSGMNINANGNDSKPVYQGWKDQGCFPEIQRRLGYRFRLLDSQIPDRAKPGSTFSMSFRVVNDGWASPYNPRLLEVILRHRQTGQQYYLPVAEPVRLWMSGETKTINIVGGIPANMPLGEYEVLLNLPDPARRLYRRPEYSIRLANQNVWQSSTGYNSLLRSIVIDSNLEGAAYSGNQFFKLR